PEEPVAERERALVGDEVDPAIEVKAFSRDKHRRRQCDFLRDEPTDQERGRGELPEEGHEPERDPAEREQQNESGDHVRRVLGAARQKLLDTRSKRQKERQQNRARPEREPEQDGEGAIRALHDLSFWARRRSAARWVASTVSSSALNAASAASPNSATRPRARSRERRARCSSRVCA